MALTDDIVFYYNLDENSGTTVDDSSENNDGTANDEEIFTSEESGIINTCADFTQGNDDINCGTLGTLGANWHNGGAISFWIKTTTEATPYIMGEVVESGSEDPFLGILTNNRDTGSLTFAYRDYTGHTTVLYTTTDNLINDGEWHHVVITWEDLTDDSTVKIYVDNSDETLDDDGTDFTDTLENWTGYRLGCTNNRGTPGSHFDGMLDEVGFWSRNLSAAEVATLYNSGSGLQYPFTTTGTNFQINISDAWKEVSAMKVNVGDAWKTIATANINIGDAWKSIF